MVQRMSYVVAMSSDDRHTHTHTHFGRVVQWSQIRRRNKIARANCETREKRGALGERFFAAINYRADSLTLSRRIIN